ncbi:MAG: hypothetical protein ACRDAM_10440 [Casimicrobium sp.]
MKNHWIAMAATITAALISIAVAQTLSVRTGAPAGWFMAGSAPRDYESTVHTDPTAPNKSYLQLKSKPTAGASAYDFGTMMQSFRADEYRGKSLRFSASVRSTGVDQWAGLWARVDGPSGRLLAFDNMQGRPIKGTTSWQRYEIVLPVPESAQLLNFGVLLGGRGEIAIRDVEFVEAPKDAPSTEIVPTVGESKSGKPANLDFKQ